MPLRKEDFFFNVRKNVHMATKPGGGGLKGLSGRATKKRTFFVASLREYITILQYPMEDWGRGDSRIAFQYLEMFPRMKYNNQIIK